MSELGVGGVFEEPLWRPSFLNGAPVWGAEASPGDLDGLPCHGGGLEVACAQGPPPEMTHAVTQSYVRFGINRGLMKGSRSKSSSFSRRNSDKTKKLMSLQCRAAKV